MSKFVGGEDVRVDWNDDFGPLVDVKRGFETRERVPFSGGLSGVEFVSEDEDMGAGPSRISAAPELPMLTVTSPTPRKGKKDVKGKGKAMEISDDEKGMLKVKNRELPALTLTWFINLIKAETTPLWRTSGTAARGANSTQDAQTMDSSKS